MSVLFFSLRRRVEHGGDFENALEIRVGRTEIGDNAGQQAVVVEELLRLLERQQLRLVRLQQLTTRVFKLNSTRAAAAEQTRSVHIYNTRKRTTT